MVRTVVLSIVLTLTAGPSAALVCRTVCHPEAAAASGCHDEAPVSSATVAGNDSCDDVVLGAAILPIEAGRASTSPGANHAVVVMPFQLANSTTQPRAGQEPARARSLDHRPLSTALRI